MNENNKELIQKALKILKDRSEDIDRNIDVRKAYESAFMIMCFALTGQKEELNQFDY